MTDAETRAEFVDRDLRGARFRQVDLSGAVLRGVVVDGVEVDSPWLCEGDASLVVNGVDVASFVDAELDRRFPGRALRRADSPDGLREAWSAVERTWEATMERASQMPAGTIDVSVGGEWTLAQTLRHLVMATDTWLGKAVLEREQPYHPVGLPDASYEADGADTSPFSPTAPTFAEVLDARSGRIEMVRDVLADLTPGDLTAERRNPHDARYPETVLSCLRTILEEEWEHHRYVVRDLDDIHVTQGG